MDGIGSREGEGGLFLGFRLVCILILSLLLSLESLEKFVWWWWVVGAGGGGWCVNQNAREMEFDLEAKLVRFVRLYKVICPQFPLKVLPGHT